MDLDPNKPEETMPDAKPKQAKAESDLMNLLADIRYFQHYPDNASCFLCGTRRDEPCVLIGIDGTTSGRIEEAIPIHLKCMMNSKNWRVNRPMGIMYGRRFAS